MKHLHEEIEITQRLFELWKKMRRRIWETGILQVLMAALVVLFCFGLTEWIFEFGRIGRGFLLILVLTSVASASIYFLFRPLKRFPFNRERMAKLIGNMIPEIGDKLINALQIYQESPENAFSRAALISAYQSASLFNFQAKVYDDRWFRKFGPSVLSLSLFSLLLFLPPIQLSEPLKRILFFYEHFSPPEKFQLKALSGDLEVLAGKEAVLQFTIVSLLEGVDDSPPHEMKIFLVNKDGFSFAEQALIADSSGKFNFKMRSVKEALHYYGVAKLNEKKTITSDTHRIALLQIPSVNFFQLSIKPPGYTGLQPVKIEPNFGDATVIRGSEIELNLRASTALLKARTIIDSPLPDVIEMSVRSDSAKVKLSIRENTTYRFLIEDKNEVKGELSPKYQIKAIGDNPPELKVVAPSTPEFDIPQSMKLPVIANLRDDFGFSRFSLFYRNSKSNYKEPEQFYSELILSLESAEGSKTEKRINYQFDLSKIQISEGDELEFYLQVWDNDAVLGFKSVKSETFKLRLPTLDELYTEVEKEEESILKNLDDKIEKAAELQRELEAVQDELRQKVQSDWQDRKAIEQAMQKQKELQASIEEVKNEMREMLSKAEERELLSEETLKEYEEVMKLMDEVKSAEIEKARAEMEKALSQMNEQKMREALKNFSMNEKKLKEVLERTKELLTRKQIERKIDEMITRMDALSEKQDKLQLKTERELSQPAKSEKVQEEKAASLAQEQEKLKQEYQELQAQNEELKSLMQSYPKQDKLPTKEQQDFEEEMKFQDVTREMNEAAKEIKERKLESAKEKQQSVQAKMKSQKDRLASMKREVTKQRKEEVLDAMQNLAHSALELSLEQEELRGNIDEPDMNAGTEEMRQKAAGQQELLESLRQMQQSISNVGKKSSQVRQELSELLQKAASQMEASIRQLENRNTPAAQLEMQSAMQNLNEFASRSAEMMAAMQNQGQGGEGGGEDGEDLGESMNGLAGEQGKLNEQTQEMGSREEQSKSERMSQLAAQQMALKEQLEGIRQRQKQKEEKASKDGKPSSQELLGNLDELASEMEQTAKELAQNQFNKELVSRQQKILTRMLESTRSLQKREEEEQREAKSAKSIFKRSPAELPKTPPPNRLRDALKRLKEQGFTEDYERIIRRYYEKIDQTL
ncbi:MAG: DUF4175 family protein [Chloroherpetonaceae bacterium]|nr:DUF4175 family protein [Chloroherpetonaceae bacterium]